MSVTKKKSMFVLDIPNVGVEWVYECSWEDAKEWLLLRYQTELIAARCHVALAEQKLVALESLQKPEEQS